MSAKLKILPLLPDEEAALQEHELTISQGLAAFIAVGLALLAIRDGKLYRAQHKTFEDYCKRRWDISRPRAYQLMEAAEIAQDLSTNGRQEIANERQARALAMVPPHLRTEVLDRIKEEGGELTEQSVTRTVNVLLDQKRQEARDRAAAGIEEDGQAEEEGAAPQAETPSEATLRRAAGHHEKPRVYLARGLEHLRLALKDLRKVAGCDLETDDARQAAREALDAADQVFSDVRMLVGEAEREAAA